MLEPFLKKVLTRRRHYAGASILHGKIKTGIGIIMKIKKSIYREVKNIIEQARSQSLRAVNFAMVQAYWNIGQVIVEEEQKGRLRAEYGKHLLKELSVRMTEDFGKGYDPSNLRYMRLFYLSFPICDAVRHKSQESSTEPGKSIILSWK